MVHRQQLLDQWQERLGMFLDMPAKSIGHIGGGKMDRTGCVDVAVIQSLYRKDEVKDFVAEYGQVIVDECHHLSAFTFEQVMRQVKAKYVVGLTATPTRKDGHHPIIYMQCGPVRFNMSARTMTESTPFEHKVTPRHTEFRMASELTEVTIQDIYAALVNDVSRNEMIANDIVRAIDSGRCPLLLTGRTEHLQYFATKLAGAAKHVFVLKGGMGKKQRRATAAALASVPENESRVILTTGSYIGEGFDDARLDTLFLAMPISWKGTLQQYVGRLHRLPRQQAIRAGLRLRGQLCSNAGQDVPAQAEGLCRDWLCNRTGKVSARSFGCGGSVFVDRSRAVWARGSTCKQPSLQPPLAAERRQETALRFQRACLRKTELGSYPIRLY